MQELVNPVLDSKTCNFPIQAWNTRCCFLLCNWTTVGTETVIFSPFINPFKKQRQTPRITRKPIKTASTQPVQLHQRTADLALQMAAAAAPFWHSPLGIQPVVVCHTGKPLHSHFTFPKLKAPSKIIGTYLTLFDMLLPTHSDAQAQ